VSDADDLAIFQGVIALTKFFSRDVIAEGLKSVSMRILCAQLYISIQQHPLIHKADSSNTMCLLTYLIATKRLCNKVIMVLQK
jgi:hypothetical protein